MPSSSPRWRRAKTRCNLPTPTRGRPRPHSPPSTPSHKCPFSSPPTAPPSTTPSPSPTTSLTTPSAARGKAPSPFGVLLLRAGDSRIRHRPARTNHQGLLAGALPAGTWRRTPAYRTRPCRCRPRPRTSAPTRPGQQPHRTAPAGNGILLRRTAPPRALPAA